MLLVVSMDSFIAMIFLVFLSILRSSSFVHSGFPAQQRTTPTSHTFNPFTSFPPFNLNLRNCLTLLIYDVVILSFIMVFSFWFSYRIQGIPVLHTGISTFDTSVSTLPMCWSFLKLLLLLFLPIFISKRAHLSSPLKE